MLRLKADEETKAIYPYDFELYYKVELRESALYTELKVVALTDLQFTALLDTYFKVERYRGCASQGTREDSPTGTN